ncbi:MAG: putative transport system ATP-binding protein [Actinomycetota bacterium]|nr:putative transport system ATP-binding protein [Actinomycetota bacterium]
MDSDVVVRDITIEYSSGGYVARPIDGLDLDAKGGELVLLLGASGCGKTSLLSVLAGILRPARGSAVVAGVEVTALRGAALTHYRRDTVGVVFQAFNLVPSLTALENTMAPLRAARVPRGTARERARQLLEQVGLADRLQFRPGDLSGGQQQRVAIARALVHDPPVLLADEPTAHLDYIQVEGVLRIVRDLADSGRTVIVATHDERIMPLADRVVHLTAPAAGTAHEPERIELANGEVLFQQGDRGELVYVVDEGAVEIVRVRDDGTEERLNTVGPGNYFGEFGPMFGLPRSATARAVGATVLTGYGLREFRDHFQVSSPSRILAGAGD